MYEGKAADRAAAHGGDNVRVLLVEGTVYPFAEISPEAGTENVGTSVCVKLAYSPSQFVHPLKLIALCVSYGQLHIFYLRFHPVKASFLFFVRGVYRAACTPRICPHGCPRRTAPISRAPAADCHSADIPRPCAEFSLRF